MSTEHKITYEFWENIKEYDKEIVSVFAKKENNMIIKEIKKIKNKKDKIVLDLGCGAGNSFEYLKKFKEIHAVDFSTNMLNLAQEKKEKNIYFYKQNLLELNINEKFNIIFAIMSIFPQNFNEFKIIIENIKKQLKTNGTIYLVVQSIESATLYFQIIGENLFKKGLKPQEIIDKINNETKIRNYHPFGYFKTNKIMIQKHWLKEEIIYRLEKEHQLKVEFIKKLELDWTKQFKYSEKQSEMNLWYWFLKINKI